ncbi:hypothetical protein ABPG72_009973 [Tetrahymena utriculariae]
MKNLSILPISIFISFISFALSDQFTYVELIDENKSIQETSNYSVSDETIDPFTRFIECDFKYYFGVFDMNKEISRSNIFALPLDCINLSYYIEILLLSFTSQDKIQLILNGSILELPTVQSEYIQIQDISCSQFSAAKLYKIRVKVQDDYEYLFSIKSVSQVQTSGAKFAIRNFQFSYDPDNSTSCYYQCDSCLYNQKTFCNSCKSYRMRKLTQDGQCLCPEGYYESMNYDCLQDFEKCPDSCLKCKNTSSKICLDCGSLYNRVLKQGRCVCKDGYYQKLNNKLCLACSSQCKTCLSDSKRCLICADLRVKDSQGNCVCQQGYYEKADGTCAACGLGCNICQDNLNCQTCKSLNTNIVNGVCQCLDSYYMDPSTQICSPCSSYCKICKNQNECTQCKTQAGYIQQNNQCICPSFSFDDGKQCVKCQQKCASCSKLNTCDTCLQPYELENGQCLCKDGFYENPQQQCQLCSEKCRTCDNSLSCLSCKNSDKYILDNSNMCVCNDGTYEDLSQKTCLQCNERCTKCTDINKCTECKKNTGLSLIDQQCVCKLNEYYDSKDQICKQCAKNCAECLSETKCLRCINDGEYQYDAANQKCNCQDGFYRDELEDKYLCFYCHFSCKSCSYFNICKECSFAGAILDNLGNCECPLGYFTNLNSIPKKCDKCLDSCKNCNNYQYCTSCLNDQQYQMDNLGNCICRKGYFMKDQLCLQCNEVCSQCTSDQQCTECIDSKMIILDGKCLCPDRFYYEKQNKVCLPCSKFCKKCLDSNRCTQCIDEDGYQLLNNSCKCRQDGYFQKNDGSCSPCEYTCLQCADEKSCISCKYNGTFLSQISKFCVCGDGLNFDKVTNTCTKCLQGCKTCDSKLSCLECSDNVSQYLDLSSKQCKCRKGYFLDNNGICQKCDEMCFECFEESGKCTSCTYPDTVLQNYQCLCKQEQSYFDLSLKKCQQCNKFCKDCINKNTCISCLDNENYDYSQQTGLCKCAADRFINFFDGLCQICLPPLLIHENMQCLHTCPFEYLVFQNLCIQNCPESYVNINGVCTKTYCDSKTCRKCNKNQIDCDQCIQNFYLMLGGLCKQCDSQNEYYNQQQKQCQKCDITCDKCTASTSSDCIKCKFARNSSGNKCLSSCNEGEYPFKIKDEKYCKTCYIQEGKCRMDNCGQGYYIEKGNICVKCDQACLTCKGDKPNQCLTCLDNLFLEQGRCLQCRYGFYFDQNEKKCLECHYSCLECIGPNENQCKTCSYSLNLSKISGKCIKPDQYEKEVDEKMKADSIGCTSQDFSVCQDDINFMKQTSQNLKMEMIVNISINSIFGVFFQQICFQNMIFIQQNQLLGNLKNSTQIVVYGIFQNYLKLNSYFNLFNLFFSDSQNSNKENNYKKLLDGPSLNNTQKEKRSLQKIDQQDANQNEQNVLEREFFLFKCLIQLIGMLVLYLSIFILHLLRNKSQVALKCYEYLRWNLVIRYNMIFSNYILYYAIKEIIGLDFSSVKSILSSSSAIFYVLIYLIHLIFQFKFLFFQKCFADNDLRAYYSALFQLIKVEHVLQKLFWVIYDVKRLICIVVQVIVQQNTALQIYVITSANGLFLIYLMVMRPIESTVLFFCCAVIEIINSFLIAFLILLLKYPESTSLSQYFIYSLFAYHAIALILCMAQVVFQLVMIINQKRILKKKEIQGITNQVLVGFQLNINIDSFLNASAAKNLYGPKKLILKKKINIEMEKI